MWHVWRTGKAHTVFLIGKLEGQRKIERRKLRCKNIKMHLKIIKWQSVNWVYLAQDTNLCKEFLDQLSEWPSGRILLHGVS